MSKIDYNIIKEFFFDTYLIDSHLKVREKFKQCTTKMEKEELYHHFQLNNLFLIRRCHDPGFYLYVLDKVNKNEKIKATVKKYTNKLVTSSLNFEQELFGSFSNEVEDKLIDKEIKNPITWPFSSSLDKAKNFDEVNDNSLYYFSKRLQHAIDNGEENEFFVLSQLISDYKSGYFKGYQIFSEDNLYGEQVGSHRWLYSQSQYMLENIKFCSHYYYSHSFNIHNLVKLNPHDVKFVKKLVKIIKEMTDDKELSMLDTLMNYNKFINDAFSVASLIWFNSHNEMDKINILNSEYPFEISDNILEEYKSALCEYRFCNNEKNDYFELSIFANELFQSCFFEEARIIWTSILKSTENTNTKFSCYDNLATTLRELGKFDEAIDYYKKSLVLAEELSKSKELNEKNNVDWNQLTTDETEKQLLRHIGKYVDKNCNYTHKMAVELKNIGEMYYQLGETEIAEKYFLETEDKCSELSPSEKSNIYFNLACANRRLGRFNEEFTYLSKILNENGINPLAEERALERMSILNSMEFMLQDGSFDYNKLNKIENIIKVDELSKNGTSLFHTFQFAKSMDYFEKEYKIEKLHGFSCFNSLNYNATYNLYCGNFLKAKDLCKELIDNSQEPVYAAIAKIDIGLIDIKENNFDEGIKHLEDSCDIFTQLNNGLLEFIITIINTSTLLWSKGNVDKIIDSLETKIISKDINFHLIAGCAYLEVGFFENAFDYFERGLNTKADNETKSLLLYNKGLAYSGIGKTDKAIENYQKSLDCLKSVYAWESMAKEYRRDLETIKAKECIEEAINLSSEDDKKRLENIKEELDALSSKRLNLSSLKDDNIRKTLYSAEKLMISDIKKMEDINERDFSTSLHYYGKALENMLDSQISNQIRQIIYDEFGYCVCEDYSKFKRKEFPQYLKYMLDKNKKGSIGLNGWRTILQYVNEKSKNPVYQKFKDELIKRYSPEDMQKIKFACGMISSYRNDSVHKNVKSYDEVLNVRQKIVLHLNNAIYILYK
ncbi:tetratricopeptide repeat protein [Methanolobus psychrotolerans]|uniref:tetratricopeptide repeat protein n=1 Tax=Methanolobus psychrotolerans TaxID=1874706 RepID=UPI000B919C40|nr:tetratricopeptide repeat protein [Methanolobus psychrotolerans]